MTTDDDLVKELKAKVWALLRQLAPAREPADKARVWQDIVRHREIIYNVVGSPEHEMDLWWAMEVHATAVLADPKATTDAKARARTDKATAPWMAKKAHAEAVLADPEATADAKASARTDKAMAPWLAKKARAEAVLADPEATKDAKASAHDDKAMALWLAEAAHAEAVLADPEATADAKASARDDKKVAQHKIDELMALWLAEAARSEAVLADPEATEDAKASARDNKKMAQRKIDELTASGQPSQRTSHSELEAMAADWAVRPETGRAAAESPGPLETAQPRLYDREEPLHTIYHTHLRRKPDGREVVALQATAGAGKSRMLREMTLASDNFKDAVGDPSGFDKWKGNTLRLLVSFNGDTPYDSSEEGRPFDARRALAWRVLFSFFDVEADTLRHLNVSLDSAVRLVVERNNEERAKAGLEGEAQTLVLCVDDVHLVGTAARSNDVAEQLTAARGMLWYEKKMGMHVVMSVLDMNAFASTVFTWVPLSPLTFEHARDLASPGNDGKLDEVQIRCLRGINGHPRSIEYLRQCIDENNRSRLTRAIAFKLAEGHEETFVTNAVENRMWRADAVDPGDRLVQLLECMLNPDEALAASASALWFEVFHARWQGLKTWAACEQRLDGMSMQEFYGGGELAAALPADWEIDTSRINATAALDPGDLETNTTVELGVPYWLPNGCPSGDLLRVLPLTDGSLVYEVTECKFYKNDGRSMTSSLLKPALVNSMSLLTSLREDKRVLRRAGNTSVKALATGVTLPKPEKGKLAHDLLVMAGTFDSSKVPPDSRVLVAGRASLRELYGDAFWGASYCASRSSSRTFCTMAFSGARPAVHAVLRRVPHGVPAPAGIARSLAMGALRAVRLVR